MNGFVQIKNALFFSHESKQQTSNGYTSIKRTYRCTECLGCPFQETCAKGKETKSISVSVKNQKQRKRSTRTFTYKRR